MYYELHTAIFCLLGWLLHWLGGWGTAWKATKLSLIVYLFTDPPALLFSIVATVTLYLLGPTALGALDVAIPGDALTVKLLAALATGYMADSLVGKLAALVPRSGP